MSETVDPYHTWLGIPPKDQPPTLYRLLGIELFEADQEVIENAADQRMAHLRTFQAGRHGQMSQQLLNEVAAAKICLLNKEEKAAYDVQLLRKLDAEPLNEVDLSQENLLEQLSRIAPDRRYAPARRSVLGPWLAIAGGLVVLGLTAGAWVYVNHGPNGRPLAARPPAVAPEPPDDAVPIAALAPAHEPAQPGGKTPEPAPSAPVSAPEPGPDEIPATAWPPGAGEGPAKARGEAEMRAVHAARVAETPIAGTSAPRLKPVPDEEAQAQAMKVAEDIYRSDYEQAKTPGQKQTLASRLLQQSHSAELPPADRFVLLRLARDVALRGGDGPLAFAAIDRMAESFDVDGLAMKAEALPGLARLAKGPSGHKAIAEQAAMLAREALREDKLSVAAVLARLVQSEAAKVRDKQTAPMARDLIRDVQESEKGFAEASPALAALKTRPDDPAANLAAGRYCALVKGDWRRGLAHLSKGSDGRIKAAAEEDLKLWPPAWKPAVGVPPPDPVPAAAAMRLAESWWELGQAEKGKVRDSLLQRAGFWYEDVAAGPDAGAHFEVIDKRRQALTKLGLHVPAKPILTNGLGMKFVLIRAGEFLMGSAPEEVEAARQRGATPWYLSRLALEIPRHRVTITRPFYLGVHEVTQSEYEALVGDNPSAFSATGADKALVVNQDTSRNPVEMVDWNEAARFAERLSTSEREQRASRLYRLPTEAEWEYACRAGTTTAWSSGDDQTALAECAWCSPHGGARTHPVGEKRPNAWGLFDMHGNASEWCSDWLSPQAYSQPSAVDPQGPASGTYRVFRGGCCNSPPEQCRSAFRRSEGGEPDYRFHALGFRLALECRARPAARKASPD